MSNDKKKHQKKKQRELAIKQKKVYDQQRSIRQAKLDSFPAIKVGNRDADPEFIDAVIDAAQSINFLDEKQVSPSLQAYYRIYKSQGLIAAQMYVGAIPQLTIGKRVCSGATARLAAMLSFGMLVYDRIPPDVRSRFIPFNDLNVALTESSIVLNFSSIKEDYHGNDPVFYNPLEPKVVFEGIDYIAGFSSHAVERICERLRSNYLDFGNAGEVFAFFRNCVYFEPTFLHNEQPAFALYDWCDMPGFTQYETYTKGVLGEENIVPNGGRIYYKIGYCPVVFVGKYAKAKSFILPGFRSTPEYGLLLHSNIPRQLKEKLIQKATDSERSEINLLGCFDSELSKWFHDNGIPQVVQMDRQVFVPTVEEKKKYKFSFSMNPIEL